jgi:ABC-2 type transport system permease protein
MRRLWMIAVREYLSYLRTAGFWISLCIVPLVVGFLALGGSGALRAAAPPPRIAIVDLSRSGFIEAAGPALAGPPALAELAPPPPQAENASSPAAAARALAPLLSGRDAPLDAAAVVSGTAAQLKLDVWSRNTIDPGVSDALRALAAERMRQARLEAEGVSPRLLREATQAAPDVRRFSPSTHAELTARDQTPMLMAMYLSLVLLVSLMTAAGILLNSIIEEKSGRILEILMSSASIPEILGGKILGVAALTVTVLCVWAGFGLFALLRSAPGELAPLLAALTAHGLGLYFALFFAAGYLMYACVFAALGAFCETSREAQTLVGPLMILLSIPVVFLTTAIQRPDAPVVAVLSFIPPFTPFLMPARIAAGLSPWQAFAGLALVVGTAAAVVGLCGRAFRAGALSSGRLELKQMLRGAFKQV